MATEAERLLAGSGWLPEPLRMEDLEAAAAAGDAEGTDADTLPDFLAGDEDDALEEEEPDSAHRIAAE